MKKYILIVVLIVVAIGVGATFLVLNLDSINHATVVATVVGEGGSMNDVGEKTYEKNTNPQYIISANSGYHIKSVVVDGKVLVSESEFKTPHSRIKLPNIKNPTKATESGATIPATTVIIIGKRIFVVCETALP